MKTMINEIRRFQKIAGILKEDMQTAESEPLKVSLFYNDAPSISHSYYKKVSKKFKDIVEKLGGQAVVIEPAKIDRVDFKITGISSFDQLNKAYKLTQEEDEPLQSWRILKTKDLEALLNRKF